MSASQHEALVGDIIEIEHTDDTTATAVSWTLIGRTADAIELAPNTESATRNLHEQKDLDEAVTSRAWEISFARDITVSVAGLEAIGLYDSTTGELLESHDTRVGTATNEALQISVYENESQRDAGTVKYQLGIDSYVLKHDGGEINVDDWSSMDLIVRCLSPPKRLDQDGTLD